MITIDKEARQNAALPLAVDNFAERYKTANGLYTFPSPEFWTIEKNLFYLMKNSVERDFDVKYTMKPEYMAYDEYGTVVLAPLIMYMNNVFSIEEFDLNTVILPTMNAVIAICKDKIVKTSVAKMTTVSW